MIACFDLHIDRVDKQDTQELALLWSFVSSVDKQDTLLNTQ